MPLDTGAAHWQIVSACSAPGHPRYAPWLSLRQRTFLRAWLHRSLCLSGDVRGTHSSCRRWLLSTQSAGFPTGYTVSSLWADVMHGSKLAVAAVRLGVKACALAQPEPAHVLALPGKLRPLPACRCAGLCYI